MQKISLIIDGMKGAEDVTKITDKLRCIDGVMLVNVSCELGVGDITFDDITVDAEVILDAIQELGYTVADNTMHNKSTLYSLLITAVAVGIIGVLYLALH